MGREIRMIYDVDDFDSDEQSSNSDANLLDESESGSDTSSEEGEDKIVSQGTLIKDFQGISIQRTGYLNKDCEK